MLSFFSRKELAEHSGENPSTDGAGEPKCSECGAYRFVKSPKMPVCRKGNKKILLMLEAPGEDEDRYNIQVVGKTGQFLKATLKKQGFDMDDDCWTINAMNCRPLKNNSNRPPEKHEIIACRPYVYQCIDDLKPELIIAFGGASVESLFGHLFNEIKIDHWRGLVVPSKRFNCWIAPVFHPSYIMRGEQDENLQALFNLDLHRALLAINRKMIDIPDYAARVKKLDDPDEAIAELETMLKLQPEFLARDYETTGIKPHRQGHAIATINACYSPEFSFAFPYQYRDYPTRYRSQFIKIKSLWRAALSNPAIKKIAHNKKFEYSWESTIIGVQTASNYACTMNTAHIIDDRKKYTKLKRQGFIQFGVEPYDSHIEPYLKSTEDSEFNRVMEIDLDELLEYGGMDALLTYLLYFRQQEILQIYGEEDGCRNLKYAADFFERTENTFIEMSGRGVYSDLNYYIQEKARVKVEIEKLKERILESEENKRFRQVIGRDLSIKTNVSDDDLRVLLYDKRLFGYEPEVLTDSEKPSVDAEALEQIDLPLIKDIELLKRYNKIDGTYINQFIRNTVDHKVHTIINLNRARSFRSSSSDPNLQNIPTREEEAKKSCRSGIYARPGHQLLFADFKGIEVCGAAMYSRDQNLKYYIETPGTDMHRDQAMDIWQLTESQMEKTIRFYAKNCFVFPQFYGDWYGACAKALWKNCRYLKTSEGVRLIDHVRSKMGVKNLQDFTQWMKGVEDRFWQKFHGLKDWQERTIGLYRKIGRTRLKHGFMRQGYLKKNQVGNTPIQGTAFHLLCETMNRCGDRFKELDLDSYFALQIHDEQITDLNPDEYTVVRETMEECVGKIIPEEFSRIKFTLVLEFECAPVNHPWYFKTEIDHEGRCAKKGSPFEGEMIVGNNFGRKHFLEAA